MVFFPKCWFFTWHDGLNITCPFMCQCRITPGSCIEIASQDPCVANSFDIWWGHTRTENYIRQILQTGTNESHKPPKPFAFALAEVEWKDMRCTVYRCVPIYFVSNWWFVCFEMWGLCRIITRPPTTRQKLITKCWSPDLNLEAIILRVVSHQRAKLVEVHSLNSYGIHIYIYKYKNEYKHIWLYIYIHILASIFKLECFRQ